jgi:hypothetical protein
MAEHAGEFAREIRTLALQGIEETEAFRTLSSGETGGEGTAEQGFALLGALVANQARQIVRIADAIDELRERLDAAEL